MNSITRTILAVSSAALLCGAASLGMAGKGASARLHEKPMHYKEIEPIIKSKCVACHNDKRAAASVNLASYKALMASNVVTAGHPEKSRLFTYVDGSKKPRMPLRAPALSDKEIGMIKKWIKTGAK